jgi:hypothetical protein
MDGIEIMDSKLIMKLRAGGVMELVLIRDPKHLIVHRHFIVTPKEARLKVRTRDRRERRCTKAARTGNG